LDSIVDRQTHKHQLKPSLPTLRMQSEGTPCDKACDRVAIVKGADGSVRLDADKCDHIGACETACPCGTIGTVVVPVYVTEGIHPKVIAVSNSLGHVEHGRAGNAKCGPRKDFPGFDDHVIAEDQHLSEDMGWGAGQGLWSRLAHRPVATGRDAGLVRHGVHGKKSLTCW
jgi:Fe-S-cluster-containing hydrogenase component 2